jgi:hypothetical protein
MAIICHECIRYPIRRIFVLYTDIKPLIEYFEQTWIGKDKNATLRNVVSCFADNFEDSAHYIFNYLEQYMIKILVMLLYSAFVKFGLNSIKL